MTKMNIKAFLKKIQCDLELFIFFFLKTPGRSNPDITTLILHSILYHISDYPCVCLPPSAHTRCINLCKIVSIGFTKVLESGRSGTGVGNHAGMSAPAVRNVALLDTTCDLNVKLNHYKEVSWYQPQSLSPSLAWRLWTGNFGLTPRKKFWGIKVGRFSAQPSPSYSPLRDKQSLILHACSCACAQRSQLSPRQQQVKLP